MTADDIVYAHRLPTAHHHGASRDLSPAQRCTLLEAVAIELRGHAKLSNADLDRAMRGALSGLRADDRCRARGAAVPLFLHLNHSNVLARIPRMDALS